MKFTKKSAKAIIAAAAACALVAAVGLAGCSGTGDSEDKTITVGASPTPHAEILNDVVAPLLEEEGYTLEVQEFEDYVQPNTAVDEGEIDANYFQHRPYLESFNEENGTDLVEVTAVHYEPMGLYPGTVSSLDDLQEGDKVAVPNDTTNEARALLLLEQAGLITLDEDAGIDATAKDIVDNPLNLEFVELEAATVPRQLEEVAIAAINANYAVEADLNPAEDALETEDADGEAAQTYENLLVVKSGNENSEKIQALAEALNSDEVRDYINENYDGAVLPVF